MNAKSAARGECWGRLRGSEGRVPAGFTFFLFNEVLFIPAVEAGAKELLWGEGRRAGISVTAAECKYLA